VAASRFPPRAARRFTLGCILAFPLLLSAAVPPSANSQKVPFLRLRDLALEYHGPSRNLGGANQIRIGWFGPTNLNDPLNGDLWWTLTYAVRQANASIPARASATDPSSRTNQFQFSLVPRWSVNPWASGVSELARMIYSDAPLALMGSVDSASTHLAEQIVAKANLPLISPVTTDQSTTLAGVPWIFSCAPSDAAVARVLVRDLLTGPRQKSVLLNGTDHESRMTGREVLKEMSRRGCLPDLRIEISPGKAPMDEQLQALAKASPRTILVVAGPEDSARWVRALRRSLPQAAPHVAHGIRIYGTHVVGRSRFLELAGDAAEGLRFPLLCQPASQGPATNAFVAAFLRDRGHPPDYAAVLTYDAACLLFEAVWEAGPDRSRLREVLARRSGWTGLAGDVGFDGTGQNTRANLVLARFERGAIVPWPPENPLAHKSSSSSTP